MNTVLLNPILVIAIGAVLLLAGRKVFWLFVGVAGFLAGMEIAERFLSGPQNIKLIIALLIGIVGAILAVLFYKVAVASRVFSSERIWRCSWPGILASQCRSLWPGSRI